MRTWGRVAVDTICGGCGKVIPEKAPALTITVASIRKTRVRCEGCVGDAPPDLPALIERDPNAGVTPIRKVSGAFRGKIWKRG